MAELGPGYTIEEHTAGDGYRWRYRRYHSGQVPRAHVIGIHGIQSHGGWYEYSCNRLCQAGFEVSFLDRRGSGLNEQERGDTPSFRRLVDDLAEFIQKKRQGEPSGVSRRVGGEGGEPSGVSRRVEGEGGEPSGVSRRIDEPVILMAISWGGKLAVALQRRHPGLVDGLALLCPGFCPQVGVTWKERCRIAWARLWNPRKLFPIPLNDPHLFTANPRWQRFVQADPLSLRQATARLLVESLRLDGYLRICTDVVRVPVLTLLAGQDGIIDNARTRRFIERLGASDKEVIEYPEAHHTLEFEPEPDRFIDDLVRWLERAIDLRGTPGG